MTRQLFGTDGIRGLANAEPMTAQTALRVGMAAGALFTRGDHRHRAVIGKDTRLSGYMLEPALTAGFIAMGMDVIMVGPMPTPAVAMLTRSLRADIGVMISASHNGYRDNGIKLFGPDGYKLSDDAEAEIEALIDSDLGKYQAASAALGRAQRLDDAQGRYIEFVKNTFPRGSRLDGLKVVIDCANGAGYRVAPTALWELGAEVIPMGVEPDGFNINRECGSTDTAAMQEAVRRHGADIGIALDGDADRVLIADEEGALLDGDQLMAAIAGSWQETGRLKGGGLVATVMSNLGLEDPRQGKRARRGKDPRRRPLCRRAHAPSRVQRGRRAVRPHHPQRLQHHRRRPDRGAGGAGGGGPVGAEGQRGVDACSRRCRNSSGTFPSRGQFPLDNESVQNAVRDAESRLGRNGRVLIRKSGTEPLIRVMAEGRDETLIADVVSKLVDAIERVAA